MNTEFILGLNGGGALPIELLEFTAKSDLNNSVALEWTTASEVNNDYFELQKSNDGVNFETFAKVKSKGNSNTQKNIVT